MSAAVRSLREVVGDKNSVPVGRKFRRDPIRNVQNYHGVSPACGLTKPGILAAVTGLPGGAYRIAFNGQERGDQQQVVMSIDDKPLRPQFLVIHFDEPHSFQPIQFRSGVPGAQKRA